MALVQVKPQNEFQDTYAVVEADFKALFVSVKRCADQVIALERAAATFQAQQSSLNKDMNRRICELGTDLRNNRKFEEKEQLKQLDQLEALERDKVAWIEELNRLEEAVKQIGHIREGRNVEQKYMAEETKKLITELQDELDKVRKRTGVQRVGTIIVSVVLLLVGVYVKNSL